MAPTQNAKSEAICRPGEEGMPNLRTQKSIAPRHASSSEADRNATKQSAQASIHRGWTIFQIEIEEPVSELDANILIDHECNSGPQQPNDVRIRN
jgi:hypothetical protein